MTKFHFERLRALLDYDQHTGIFRHRIARGGINAGDVSGCIKNDGYIRIKIDDRGYYAHRLAWLWMTGKWPAACLDHKDRNKANNAWSNLRLATRAQNAANSKLKSNNTSEFRGVSKERECERWRAEIRLGGKRKYLGCFKTKEEAALAYSTAAKLQFGEFAS
jgi:hypothetical protein